jgi:hypothetical protein
MDNIEIVKEITNAFVKNMDDQEILKKYFSPDFVHYANGQATDLKGYSVHLSNYMGMYKTIKLLAWDELFAVDDKVVVSYILESETKEGVSQKAAVMAIWRLKDGKVVSLREVDAFI